MSPFSQDRVGLGWRTELAAGIFAHRDQIDVLEVIAEDWFDAPRHRTSALRTLARQIPLQLHGTSAGLAGAERVEEKRLAKMARLVDFVQPEAWSEHLAFVRAGGWEIGHLAAVPRNASTLADTATNIDRARKIVGIAPMVENIATLVTPPVSSLSEAQWLSGVVSSSNAPLLLDLHNLYANALNFETATPLSILQSLPLESVGTVHIAGGRWVTAGTATEDPQRLIDDHLHPVPEPVFALLEELAALAPQPLTVILERDGAYPRIEDLLAELQLARAAMARGRLRRREHLKHDRPSAKLAVAGTCMQLESILAGVYVDESRRSAILQSPDQFCRDYEIDSAHGGVLASMDRTDLALAARSFARKRKLKRTNGR